MKWCSAFLSQRGEAIESKTEKASSLLFKGFRPNLHQKVARFSAFMVFVVEELLEMYRFYVLLVNNSQVRRAYAGLLHVKWEGIENSFPHHKALKCFRIVFDCSPQVDRGIVNYLPHENSPSKKGEQKTYTLRSGLMRLCFRRGKKIAW